MIGYGDLFKIFVIIFVIFIVALMFIFVFRKARDAMTSEDRRDKEYRRRAREEKERRRYERSLKDRENMMKVVDRTAQSFDNSVNTVGKEVVQTVGTTVQKVATS